MKEIDSNPYQPPLTMSDTTRGSDSLLYKVFRSHGAGPQLFRKASTLLQACIDQSIASSGRLVTCVNTSMDILVVTKASDSMDFKESQLRAYKLATLPGRRALAKMDSIWQSDFMEMYFPELDAGWLPVTLGLSDSLVVVRGDDLPSSPRYDEFQVVQVRPAGWRSLFGESRLDAINNELNRLTSDGARIITCLGDNRFLFGRSAQSRETAGYTYKLQLVPGWRWVLFKEMQSIFSKGINRMNEQGWELVSHYEGAVILLRSQDGCRPAI